MSALALDAEESKDSVVYDRLDLLCLSLGPTHAHTYEYEAQA